MHRIFHLLQPKRCVGLLALGLALAVATSGRTAADQPQGPMLVPPQVDRVPHDDAPAARIVQPHGPIGRYFAYVAPGETAGPVIAPPERAEPAEEEKPAAEPDKKPETKTDEAPKTEPKVEPEPKPELSQEMAALRDSVRRTVAGVQRQLLNTRDHSMTDILHVCLAYGCASQVRNGSSSGEPINAVTCLCWNYPCRGETPLVVAEGHITGRIGYGLQTERSQLAAILALSKVPADYPIRVGEDVRTVADMIEYEKLRCLRGVDNSFRLVALAGYLPDDATWKNDLGESWSLDQLVASELDRPPLEGSAEGVNRLMGLSAAAMRQKERDEPLKGAFERAALYTSKFHDHALKCQNPDGTWNPAYFAAVGVSRDTVGTLQSTGHILEWLVWSLPDDRLQDPEIVRAVAKVNSLLASSRYQNGATRLPSPEIAAMAHGVHALAIYNYRVFRPYDPVEEEPEQAEEK